MTNGRTVWWAKDSAWWRREGIVELGEEFGSAGPAIIDWLACEAKAQNDGGFVKSGPKSVARGCFADVDTVGRVLSRSVALGLLEDFSENRGLFVCRISGWRSDQNRANAAARKAAQRTQVIPETRTSDWPDMEADPVTLGHAELRNAREVFPEDENGRLGADHDPSSETPHPNSQITGEAASNGATADLVTLSHAPSRSVTKCPPTGQDSNNLTSSLRSDVVERDALNHTITDPITDLFDYWQARCQKPKAKLTAERRTKVHARLREGYTVEQIKRGIDGAALNPPRDSDSGVIYNDLTSVCRNGSQLERYIDRADARPVAVAGPAIENSAAFLARKGLQ